MFSVAWIAGFAVQGLGDAFGIIAYWPNNYPDGKCPLSRWLRWNRDRRLPWKNVYGRWYKWYGSFQKNASDSQKKDLERFVVIKEACGNTSAALFAFILAIGANHIGPDFWSWILGCRLMIVMLVLALILVWFHRVHVWRQVWWIEMALNKSGAWYKEDPTS